VQFLKEKRKQQTSTNDPQICEDDEGIDSILVDDVAAGDNEGQSKTQGEGGADVAKDILGTNISEKWLHMDQVEPEKLEWMKKSPSATQSGVGSTFVLAILGNNVKKNLQLIFCVFSHRLTNKQDLTLMVTF
jgi:hypothetical protein